jgi:hypothetical protein
MRRLFVEDDHHVDRLERGEDFGAFTLGVDRAALAFVRSNRAIRVDADDQHIAESPRASQIPDVAGMKEVEDAVRKDHLAAAPAEAFGDRADSVSSDDRHGRQGVSLNAIPRENDQ